MVKNPSNSKRGIETASTTLVEAATAENQPTFDSPATSLKSLLTSIHKDDPRWLSISRYIFDIASGMQDIAVVALDTSKQPTDEMEVTKMQLLTMVETMSRKKLIRTQAIATTFQVPLHRRTGHCPRLLQMKM